MVIIQQSAYLNCQNQAEIYAVINLGGSVMKTIMLICFAGSLWVTGCGSSGSEEDTKQTIEAPKVLSDFRGAFIATIPADTSYASGGFYHYRFVDGALREESTLTLKDPLVSTIDDHVLLIERGLGQQRVYQASINDISAGEALNFLSDTPAMSGLAGGDPWEILPFSDDSVLFLNANGGQIQKRSLGGQIEEEIVAADLGIEALRPVKGLRLGSTTEYLVASQGLSNSEIPVLNGKQSMIHLTFSADGQLQGAPGLTELPLQVPQDFISLDGNSYMLSGLCFETGDACDAGAYDFQLNAAGAFELKNDTPYGKKYLQYGGSMASDDLFLAQAKEAGSDAIKLVGFSVDEPDGHDFYEFKSAHITNILYDKSSGIVFFGDEKDGQTVLLVFDLNSREVLGELAVNGLPYSFAIYE